GHELIARNLVPLFGSLNPRGADCVDPQTDGGTPRNSVLHEFNTLSVVSKEERARSFQPLLGDHRLISLRVELGAHAAIRPNDSNHICSGLLPKSKMNLRAGDWLLLYMQPSANFDLSADSKWIDPLVAGCLRGMWSYELPVIIFRSVIDCLNRFAGR